MIFNQLFDDKSSTYTYIISSGKGREALIIDPVIEHTKKYIKILDDLKLKLVKVIDTHIHADHISGLNELNERTNCVRIMGEGSESEVIDIKVKDNEKIKIDLYDLLGVKLAVFKSESINLFNYPKGIYFLNVYCGDQFKQIKIMKN